MKRNIRTAMIIVLAIVFLGSSAVIAGYSALSGKGKDNADKALELVSLPASTDPVPLTGQPVEDEPAVIQKEAEEEETLPVPADETAAELCGMDIEALRDINPDVIGWIYIPGTSINYPVLQGEDNDFYLKHTWQKEKNFAGSIFLDRGNENDFSDFNSILYGHHMKNGSMFSDIIKYKNEVFFEEHPYVYIVDITGFCTRYAVFAAYETTTQITYATAFADEDVENEWIGDCMKRSSVRSGAVPSAEDRVLTLSTCTGSGHESRWVVQAYAEK